MESKNYCSYLNVDKGQLEIEGLIKRFPSLPIDHEERVDTATILSKNGALRSLVTIELKALPDAIMSDDPRAVDALIHLICMTVNGLFGKEIACIRLTIDSPNNEYFLATNVTYTGNLPDPEPDEEEEDTQIGICALSKEKSKEVIDLLKNALPESEIKTLGLDKPEEDEVTFTEKLSKQEFEELKTWINKAFKSKKNSPEHELLHKMYNRFSHIFNTK